MPNSTGQPYLGEFVMSRSQFDTPIFIITLKRGMADNHRLPLNHVIDVLKEIIRVQIRRLTIFPH
jgi:hypothetical protein